MTIRVLRLELDGGPVDLHPRLTILDAGDKPRRKGIVKALAALSSGEDPGVGGTIDAQGILLDLDTAAIELLDLSEPIDNVVRPAELSGADEPVEPEAEARASEPESEAVIAARAAHAEAVRATSIAAGALAAARAGRDPFAGTALDIARGRLAALEAGDDLETAAEQDEHTIDALRARTNELEAALVALDAVDPFPVRIALDQLGNASHRAPRVEADSVAAEIAAIDRQLAGDVGAAGPSPLLEVAQQRLQDARDALFAAEKAARVPDVDADVVKRIEEAHGRVAKAEGASGAKFRRRRARRQLEQAQREERELLDEVGFPTYADFMMGTSIANPPPEVEAQLDLARRELSDAEDMVAALDADADAALAHAVLVARRAQLQQRADELRGDHEPTAKLRAALESAGFVFDTGHVPEAVLTELASVWLEEQRDIAAHRRRVEEELVSLERRLAAANPVGADRSHEAALDDARAAVAAAEVRLARHTDADEEVARRQATYYALVTDEARAAAKVAALERPGAASLPAVMSPSPGNGSTRDLNWHLLTRVAKVRSASYAGSVPLVLDRALDGLPPEIVTASLERLERLASTVQTVVVTADETVLRWAEGLSADRAAFVR